MAQRTTLSNAYLSQIERGLHTPSVRVLRLVASALDLSVEALLAQTGLSADSPGGTGGGDAGGGGVSGNAAGSRTEEAIQNDGRLTDAQKEALLSVYRSF